MWFFELAALQSLGTGRGCCFIIKGGSKNKSIILHCSG